MLVRLLVAAAVILVAVGVAAAGGGGGGGGPPARDAPTQPRFELPAQVDRSDFDGDAWLVAVFTSDTCATCADVVRKAEVLRSGEVAVQVAPFQTRGDLHSRYRIDAVPAVLIVDALGVVQRTFVGPVTATDLWAALAEARG